MHHSLALAYAAAAWIAGTVACALMGISAWPLAIAAAALLAALALIQRDLRVAVFAAMLPALFLGGIIRFHASDTTLAADDVAHYIDGPAMRIRGELRDDPAIGDTTQRFTVDVHQVQRAGEWQPASGSVLITTDARPPHKAGDILELEGTFESPPEIEGFDYTGYLAQRGIHSVMAFPQATFIGHDDAGIARESLLSLRRRLSHGLALALPEPHASLAQGVLLGERSALPADLRDDLNATNTSHLVVVSGGNMVIIASIITAAFAWLVGRRRAMWLALAAVVAYMLLVGLSPPVVRGTIMGALLILGQVSGRRSNGIVAITFAAAAMVAVHPHAIRDVSFQLTFAATTGIIILAPPIHDWTLAGLCALTRRDALPGAVSAFAVVPLSTMLAAIIATEPLVALNFDRVSLVAVPANMLVVPIFPLILGASALAAVGGLIPHAHLALAAPAYYLLSYWMTVVDSLASLPSAAISINGFTSAWAATSYATIAVASLLALKWLPRPHQHVLPAQIPWRRLLPIATFGAPLAILGLTAGFAMRPGHAPRLHVTFLDVGQGDAILIQTPSGADILIDGGPGRAVLRELGAELAWHDRGIEMLVLTHPDGDHLDGLYDVLARYDVDRLITTNAAAPAEWSHAVARERAPAQVASSSASFDLGDGVVLDVLSPPAVAEPSDNDGSLVLRLSWRDISFLLTGDIEASAEEALLASGVDLSATVLKVPHHGSKTSSTAAFLEAVSPSISVISAGARNQHGHPAASVVDRLDDYGPVLSTAASGAIFFETDGDRLWLDDE